MPARQIYAKSSPIDGIGTGKDVEPGISHSYGDGKFAAVTLRGSPVDKSQTGRIRATKYIYALNFAHWMLLISILLNVVFYVIEYLYQDISTASNIATDFGGTAFLLAVAGGFLSDSFLGHYFSIIVGSFFELLGLAVFVLSITYSGLQPPACTPVSPLVPCPPAGSRYTGVFYFSLYTMCLGLGINNANIGTFGAEQFDDSDPEEQRQSIHYFLWLYFAQNLGASLGCTSTVYLFIKGHQGWAFGYMLPLLVVALAIFLIGTPKYRHKKVGGSFLTRIAQTLVAAVRKWRLPVPEDESRLYDEPVSGGWLKRSTKLRFLDKAGIIEDDNPTASRWRLVGVTQVEEAKRIFGILPVWVPTFFLSVAFAEVATFSAQQGTSLDRNWGPHFTMPAQSMAIGIIVFGLLIVPIYDFIILPLLRKITGNAYGISPLKRVGLACLAASLSLASAALVEKKRLTYIRRLGYTDLPYFQLPMSMWWTLPQLFFCGITEMFLFISLYEFYYHEVSDATRSIAISFLFSALGIGWIFSTFIVKVTNHVTRHHHGGAWLKERFNDGGLERYFWLLAIIGGVNFLIFLVTSSLYQYNYELFKNPSKVKRSKEQKEVELEPEAGGTHD